MRLARCRLSRERATWKVPKSSYGWASKRGSTVSCRLQVKAYRVPSNNGAETSPSAPDLSSIKLTDRYDFKKYGSSAERDKRLLRRKWDDEGLRPVNQSYVALLRQRAERSSGDRQPSTTKTNATARPMAGGQSF